MKKNRNLFILVFLLTAIVAIDLYFYTPHVNGYFTDVFKAERGSVNLKKWNSVRDLLELDGEWEFYFMDLISPEEFKNGEVLAEKYVNIPCSWERQTAPKLPYEGYATYRLTVNGLKPGQTYAFYMYEQATSFRLWINGRFSAFNGTVSSRIENFRPDWTPVLGTFVPDIDGRVVFIVQVSNFIYNRGGFWNSIKIGDLPNITNFREKKVYKAIFLFTFIFISSLSFLAFFLIDGQNIGALFFSLFTFSISARILLTEERVIKTIINMPWWLSTRLEYMSGYVLLPLFGLFFLEFFKVDYKGLFRKTFYGFLFFVIILTVFSPHRIYASFYTCYKILTVFSFLYFFYVLILSMRRKIKGTFMALMGSAFIALSVLRDFILQDHYSLFSTGVLIFIACYSFMVVQKFIILLRHKGHLEEKINIDLLTGLYNRHFFIEYVRNKTRMLGQESFFSIIFMDLDKFKYINDNYGHEAGDEVLKYISERLKGIFRDTDIIARFGGDEFLIYIENKTDEVVTELTRRIIQAVSLPILFKDNLFNVGISLGISKFPDHGDSVEELIILSDSMMYKAKKKGGNRAEILEQSEKS